MLARTTRWSSTPSGWKLVITCSSAPGSTRHEIAGCGSSDLKGLRAGKRAAHDSVGPPAMQLLARSNGLSLCSELPAEKLLGLKLIWRHDAGDWDYLVPVHWQDVLLHIQAAVVSHNWIADCTNTLGRLNRAEAGMLILNTGIRMSLTYRKQLSVTFTSQAHNCFLDSIAVPHLSSMALAACPKGKFGKGRRQLRYNGHAC